MSILKRIWLPALVASTLASLPAAVAVWIEGWYGIPIAFASALTTTFFVGVLAEQDLIPIRKGIVSWLNLSRYLTIENGRIIMTDDEGTARDI